jgi:hypothetical protein
MTEQQEERLRGAARSWLAAGDELAAALADTDTDPAEVMELADRATLARLSLHQTLVELGWTPPRPPPREAG